MALLGLALTALAAAPAVSQPPLRNVVALRWVITEVTAPPGPFRMIKNTPVALAKAQPADLFKSDSPIVRSKGKSVIPAGTLFARSALSPQVVCEPGRRVGQGTFACLGDSDGDGRFDSVSSVETKTFTYNRVTTVGYLAGQMPMAPWVPLATPVTLSAIAPGAPTETLTLNLRLTSLGAALVKGTFFSVCATRNEGKNIWGAPINVDYCRDPIRFRPDVAAEASKALTSKAILTLRAVDETGADVTVEQLSVGDLLFGPN
jgi:hypothetical protein